MRKLLLVFCSILMIVLIGCSSHGDEYTFEQWIEFDDYVGIIKIEQKESVFIDDLYEPKKIVEYRYSENIALKNNLDNKYRLFVIHSSEKKYFGTYCVFKNNDRYDECYNTETDNYISSDEFFVIIGFYDPQRSEVLGVRFLEKLENYDESKPIDEQTELNQDIISKYTSVIDKLESESTESTNTDS